jgi:hypothetical protein
LIEPGLFSESDVEGRSSALSVGANANREWSQLVERLGSRSEKTNADRIISLQERYFLAERLRGLLKASEGTSRKDGNVKKRAMISAEFREGLPFGI